MPSAELRGRRFHYEDSGGSGLPLVLSHGFLMDSEMFAPQVAAFSGRHRVITWDQRGHGRTTSGDEPYSYWDSADDLAGLLDHLAVQRAVLGGMSQGGFLSLRFALSYPERTAGLVLIDTQAGTEDPDKSLQYDLMHDVWVNSGPNDQLLEMVAAIIVGNQRPESEAWIAKWNARDPRSLTRIYRTLMDRDDLTDRLGEIVAPSIVIHGAEDTAIDLELAEALCRGLKGCEKVVRIEGAGHDSSETHPKPVNVAIERFVASLGQPV
ncbi:MAG TPA: alpha/beta hydrolase [Candidatus Limnocylindrales bacterium]|nr:alpha/beta hydrolase [Candidatus Limnocylindrales bacterium]